MEKHIIHFIEDILPKAEVLDKTLPRITMRVRLTDFLDQNNQLWYLMRDQIVHQYPLYQGLLYRNDISFRVGYRPVDNDATLPGFDEYEHCYTFALVWDGL
jgi:hypothetical protein